MRGAIVTLDIETTGLDSRRDHIIEIGAVRSESGIETAAYQTFVNPGLPIPPFITQLTGISDANLADAPLATEALPDFAAFVGEAPVLAHNARFDLGFLRSGGILQANPTLDSVELATILLPRAPRYGLGALAEQLGISLENAHRALDDARATSELYWQLWERACALPEKILREICQDEDGSRWPPTLFFQAVLSEVMADGVREPKSQSHTTFYMPDVAPAGTGAAICVVLMEAFRAREHTLLETGGARAVVASSVGAAADWARERGERVLLAARAEASLAALRGEAWRLANEERLRWAELTAPADYLCVRAWDAWRTLASLDAEERQFRARVLVWLAQGGSGNRRELRLRGPVERALWRRISAVHCECQAVDSCPWQQAQRAAAGAALIITTQAAWWAGITEEGWKFPAHGAAVICDAAQLEDALSEAKALRLEKEGVTRPMRALTHVKRGLLAELVGKGLNEEFARSLRQSARALSAQAEETFGALAAVWGAGSANTSWLSLAPERRRSAAFARAVAEGRRLSDMGEAVLAALERLAVGLAEREPTAAGANFIHSLMGELRQTLAGIQRGLLSEDEADVRWLERSKWTSVPQFCAAPRRPGRVFAGKMAAWPGALILQDAAISAGDEGEFWRERFSSPTLVWRSLSVPENEHATTLVHIPQDLPPPNDRAAYQRAFERCLLSLASEGGGRALALFTSYTHLRETASALRPRLKLGGIQIFEGNRLPAFLAAERGLLMVTRHEFQSLALPAGSVSICALARFPFDLPNFPLVAARAADYEDGFGAFSLPVAIRRMLATLRSAQMAAEERCAFVIADSRILRKRYGERFLDALPAVELRYGESAGLGAAVGRWLREGV